jgi:TatD DNase family protein
MIDTHAHLDAEAFDEDRAEVIQKTIDEGIEAIIVPAIEPEHFERVVSLSENYDKIYHGIGIHPHNAKDATEENLSLVEEYASKKKTVAIGEIGLDYYYDFAPRETQIQAFIKQLKIAKNLGLPVIVHNREATEDLFRIIKEEQDGNLRGVLHCFSENVENMEKSIDLGFFISFTGNITFKKSSMSDVVKNTPLNKLMLETDAPYMAPVPFRGKRNEPAFLKMTAEKISEIKLISLDEVITMTTKNAKFLFNLILLAIIFFTTNISLPAQTKTNKDKPKTNVEVQQEEFYNPFSKFIGFGPAFGLNTVIETIYRPEGPQPLSYEGLFTYGVVINYGIFDFLVLDGSYLYSKNNKIAQLNPGLGPNVNNTFTLSGHWIPNPYSRINFYGITGVSAFYNKTNLGGGGGKPEDNTIRYGFNTGVGFYLNIPIENIGMFCLDAQWLINFQFGTYNGYYCTNCTDSSKVYKAVEATSWYSIPRFSIIWYPEFFRKLFKK